VGRGTTFKVYLPAAEGELEGNDGSRFEIPEGQGELVLVVDDEGRIREMASLVLQASGYRVETAANGAAGVARYARGGVDAVVLDWSMPVMNGGATLIAIRDIDPSARFLVSSGLAHRKELETIEPPVPFLAKPYTTEQLLERLARLFGRDRRSGSVEGS
jgi:CheY-like chemotaxis protein